MNTLVYFCFAMALAECVIGNNIYAPYMRVKMAQNAIEDTPNHGLRERRQTTNQSGGPCNVTGRCIPFVSCPTVYKPDFNVFLAAMQDPCASFTDICCLEKDMRKDGV